MPFSIFPIFAIKFHANLPSRYLIFDVSFGSAINSRAWTDESRGYRFGFNGMEKDDEVKGAGNSYDFGARIYDSRLGRWLALDPLMADYSDLCPYNFAGNSPILFLDIDGRKFVNPYHSKVSELELKKIKAQEAYDEFVKSNPNLSEKKLRKSEAAKHLSSVQNELEVNTNKAQKVDDFINTLKLSNVEEYNYFENLKDGNNNEIKIIVNIEDEQGPQTTDGKNRINASTEITPTLSSDGVYGVVDNTISITLYEATNVITHGSIGTQTYGSFANELGDIKYFFTKVKDDESYKKWVDSGSEDSKEYDSSDGAGSYSNEYEKARREDVKKTEGTKDEKSGTIKK